MNFTVMRYLTHDKRRTCALCLNAPELQPHGWCGIAANIYIYIYIQPGNNNGPSTKVIVCCHSLCHVATRFALKRLTDFPDCLQFSVINGSIFEFQRGLVMFLILFRQFPAKFFYFIFYRFRPFLDRFRQFLAIPGPILTIFICNISIGIRPPPQKKKRFPTGPPLSFSIKKNRVSDSDSQKPISDS